MITIIEIIHHQILHSDKTSNLVMEGMDLSVMKETWEELAATEMRLQLMSELVKYGVGLADVENFNIDLKSNLKNLPDDKVQEKQDERFVKAAMDIKIRDERVTRTKLTRVRNISRTKLMKEMGRNSRKYRTAIRGLRQAAWDIKNNYKILYENKLEHLRLKFRKTEAEKLDKIPKEMEEYFELSIFDREKFDRLEASSYEVTCVGDVTLSNEEKSVLKLHPKFSIIETLQENTIEFEQELSYAKLRITINKEIQENEDFESNDEPSKTPEEEEAALEDEARSRLTFDPLTKVYNDRKQPCH